VDKIAKKQSEGNYLLKTFKQIVTIKTTQLVNEMT